MERDQISGYFWSCTVINQTRVLFFIIYGRLQKEDSYTPHNEDEARALMSSVGATATRNVLLPKWEEMESIAIPWHHSAGANEV